MLKVPVHRLHSITVRNLLPHCLAVLFLMGTRYKLHVIANELYGLSVFDEKVKFTSILSLPHPDPTRVHYMWATSKVSAVKADFI